MDFKCPHCQNMTDINKDEDVFDFIRIQDVDDLNGDDTRELNDLTELWRCCHCNGYFKTYYKLIKITKLQEKIIDNT
jgi:transposase